MQTCCLTSALCSHPQMQQQQQPTDSRNPQPLACRSPLYPLADLLGLTSLQLLA
jgi:hypothetical protein